MISYTRRASVTFASICEFNPRRHKKAGQWLSRNRHWNLMRQTWDRDVETFELGDLVPEGYFERVAERLRAMPQFDELEFADIPSVI